MTDRVINVAVAGLGGQGVLKVTDILAEALFRAGFDVKKSEVHGMSQRGGSVSSEVRFGKEVLSPMIPEGETDVLAVLDPTQVEVNRGKLRAGGVLVTPDDVPLSQLPHPKAANMMILGALSRHVPVTPDSLVAVMCEQLPAKVHAVNVEAFHLGRGKE